MGSVGEMWGSVGRGVGKRVGVWGEWGRRGEKYGKVCCGVGEVRYG